MNVREALEKANKQLMAKIDDAMTKEVFEEVQDEEDAPSTLRCTRSIPLGCTVAVENTADWEIPTTLKSEAEQQRAA